MTELTMENLESAMDKLRRLRPNADALRKLLATKYILTGDVRQYLLKQGYDTEEKITEYFERLGVCHI